MDKIKFTPTYHKREILEDVARLDGTEKESLIYFSNRPDRGRIIDINYCSGGLPWNQGKIIVKAETSSEIKASRALIERFLRMRGYIE